MGRAAVPVRCALRPNNPCACRGQEEKLSYRRSVMSGVLSPATVAPSEARGAHGLTTKCVYSDRIAPGAVLQMATARGWAKIEFAATDAAAMAGPPPSPSSSPPTSQPSSLLVPPQSLRLPSRRRRWRRCIHLLPSPSPSAPTSPPRAGCMTTLVCSVVEPRGIDFTRLGSRAAEST